MSRFIPGKSDAVAWRLITIKTDIETQSFEVNLDRLKYLVYFEI